MVVVYPPWLRPRWLWLRKQSWEFAHRFFERIAIFFLAKGQKTDLLVKKRKLLPLLFCHEQTEQIVSGRAFEKSNGSYLLNGPSFVKSD